MSRPRRSHLEMSPYPKRTSHLRKRSPRPEEPAATPGGRRGGHARGAYRHTQRRAYRHAQREARPPRPEDPAVVPEGDHPRARRISAPCPEQSQPCPEEAARRTGWSQAAVLGPPPWREWLGCSGGSEGEEAGVWWLLEGEGEVVGGLAGRGREVAYFI
jgi:hypothetical protein